MGDRLGGREAESGEIGGQITHGQGEGRVAVGGGMRRRQRAGEPEHRGGREPAGRPPAPGAAPAPPPLSPGAPGRGGAWGPPSPPTPRGGGAPPPRTLG